MKGFTIFVGGILIGLLVAAAIAGLWLAASVIGQAPGSPAQTAGTADVTVRLGDDYLSREVNRRLEGLATATVTSAPGGQMSVDLRVTKEIGSLDLSAGVKSLTRVTAAGGRANVDLVQLEIGGLQLDPASLPAPLTEALASASGALEEQLNAEVDHGNFVLRSIQTDLTGVTLLLKARE